MPDICLCPVLPKSMNQTQTVTPALKSNIRIDAIIDVLQLLLPLLSTLAGSEKPKRSVLPFKNKSFCPPKIYLKNSLSLDSTKKLPVNFASQQKYSNLLKLFYIFCHITNNAILLDCL